MLFKFNWIKSCKILVTSISLFILISGCSSQDNYKHPSGTLEATEINISAEVNGTVLLSNIEQGSEVVTGDTLLLIDTELLELQRQQTSASLNTLQARKQVTWDNYQQAQEKLEFTRLTRDRSQALFEKGNINQQKLDEINTTFAINERQVSAAKNQLNVIEAEKKQLEATLAIFDKQIADGKVISPLKGVILDKYVELGELVNVGRQLVRIADLSEMELRFYLAEEDLSKVKIGKTLKVKVDAFAEKIFKGSVKWISSEAEFTPKNAQTRDARSQLVYAVKLSLNNPDKNLMIGMPAEVLLP